LAGTQRVDCTPIVKKQAAAVRILANAEAVFERVKVALRKFRNGQAKVPGQSRNLIFCDVDGAGLAHTALTALPALELNSGIKKIWALDKRVRRFPSHGASLADRKGEFNCNILFTWSKKLL
jgi:hypothetical protein